MSTGRPDEPGTTHRLPSRSRLWHLWRWTKRILGGLVVVATVLVLAAPTITHYLLGRERERLAAAGEPLTIAEIAPTLPPGADNAADVYQQAFEIRDISQDEAERVFLSRDQPHDAVWLAAARPVVARNEAYFALLDRASRIEHCVFPVDWDDNLLETKLPHYADLREAGRALGLRARVLALEGEGDAALVACATAVRIGDHLQHEPTLIGQLVRYALCSMATRSAEHVLSHADVSPELCRDLCGELSSVELTQDLIRAMQGERVLAGIDVIERFRSSLGESRGWIGGLRDAWIDVDELVYCRVMEDQIRALSYPWPKCERRSEEGMRRMERIPEGLAPLATMIIPVYGGAAWSRAKTAAEIAAWQVALAVKAYRSEHGSYPDSLVEIADEGWMLPMDPFTGNPMHYRREGDGFIVYSLGRDMADDNGLLPLWLEPEELTETEEEHRREHYDIPFRCEQ